MHQNTSLDVQIFKISRGRPPGTPQQEGAPPPVPSPTCAFAARAAPRRITESGRIQFPPATFYKDENPDREHGFFSMKCKKN